MIESDAKRLAQCLAADFPGAPAPPKRTWLDAPAARVIDCVLSLRKPYARVVTPRVKRFAETHPTVRSCAELVEAIASYPSPHAFVEHELKMRSKTKGAAIAAVANHLIDAQDALAHHKTFSDTADHATEAERLRHWAESARPGDYLTLDAPRFGLAGFQYLRILFGAQTFKPDAHVLRYAENAIGRPIAGDNRREVRAVYALERTAQLCGVPARNGKTARPTRSATDNRGVWLRGFAMCGLPVPACSAPGRMTASRVALRIRGR